MRIGLIGFEGHAGEILGPIPRIEGAELAAVAKGHPDEDLAALRDFPAVTSATRLFDSAESMLDETELDLVGVCPRNHLIPRYARLAAERGIPVIAEKPLAVDRDTLAGLREAVDRNGVRLAALFGMRLMPAYRAAHNAVRSGLIGEPVLITAQKSYRWGTRPDWYRSRESFGGTIPWVAIHAIDYARWVSGLEYVRVSGYQSNLGHRDYAGCEDNGGLVFQLNNGGTALIHFDYLRPGAAPSHGDDRLRIAGTEGVIEIRDESSRVELMTHQDAPRDLELPAPQSLLADFIGALRGGREPVVSTEDSFRVTEIALLAREAADTGASVAL